MHRELRDKGGRQSLVLAGLIFLISSDAVAAGKPWPKLYEVVVKASVTAVADQFAYSYTLYNSTRNDLPLSRLAIDMRRNPQLHPLSYSDITTTHSSEEHGSILDLAARIRPIKVVAPPEWGFEYPGLWGVNELLDGRTMIPPGKSRFGFIVIATEPASIRDFVVEGYSWDFLENRETYDFNGTSQELIAEVSKGIEYQGKTVAPVAVPEPFSVSTWTVRLERDAIEARRLGWITTDKQLAKIRGWLNRISNAKPPALVANMRALQHYVAMEKAAGRLSDEVDALIRLNGDYLLRRLKSQ